MARRTALETIAALLAIGLVTFALGQVPGLRNATTVALVYLLAILFIASSARLAVAVVASVAAMACYNLFFLPPVGTLTVEDPENWVALGAFLVVSMVASQLSASARARAAEATARRNEVARLFDVTRDILLTTDGRGAIAQVARHVARRFELDTVTVWLLSPAGGWEAHEGGAGSRTIPRDDLDRAFASAQGTLQFDARTRSYSGHRAVAAGDSTATLVPIRLGTRPIGLLLVAGRELEPGTLDALAGVMAIAVERSQFLEEHRASELAHQRAELSSALLASLGHDLRTPLTAIRVALSNVRDEALTAPQRAAQWELADAQLDRLGRLLQEILDMARIEMGGVKLSPQPVTPADVVEAAVAQTGQALRGRVLNVQADDHTVVEVDPRIAASALAHLLENAARYSDPDTPIDVVGEARDGALHVAVTDHGSGLSPADLARLFEPFYRGERARATAPGTGLGLSITRGLLAAGGGRVWAENTAPGGARFTFVLPGTRAAASGGAP